MQGTSTENDSSEPVMSFNKEILELCKLLRTVGLKLKDKTKEIGGNLDLSLEEQERWRGKEGEMIANIMLAFRHIEDAESRLAMVHWLIRNK